LRAGIGARYSYYVQLVATKRDWMPVANLKSRQRGGEAGRAQSCSIAPYTNFGGVRCRLFANLSDVNDLLRLTANGFRETFWVRSAVANLPSFLFAKTSAAS